MSHTEATPNVKQAQKVETPRQYAVVLFNDDFTPMGFVVQLLQYVFAMDLAQASTVMLEVHEQGQAVAGTFPREIAETKVTQALRIAAHFGHPFHCEARPV